MSSRKICLIIFILLSIPSGFLLSNALYKPKVFDCFLFFNEFDVLEIRLNELYDKVDKFVLVESTRSFSNKEKVLYFNENKQRYSKFLDKIVHVVVDEFPEFSPIGDATDYWEVEFFQRNQIMKGLKNCKPNNRDVVIITDVDEIIRKEKIDKIAKLIDKKHIDVVYGEFEFYRYFINRKSPNDWCIAIATSWENLSKYLPTPQSLRDLSGFSKGHAFNGFEVLEAVKHKHPNKKWGFGRIQNMGWHFTSLGDFANHLYKIANYSHLSVNSETNQNIDTIKKKIADLKWCPVDDAYPKYILDNRENVKFQNMIDEPETKFH